ncbi:MAG: pirin-like C-terminal cupin domain-containing protein, partial [Gammaproteobacteria bacterium]
GALEMAQLWVNLPAKQKMSAPRYQTILNAGIPTIELADGAGSLRVIAGSFDGHGGPAATFSPLNVWDLRLQAGRSGRLALPEGHIAAIAVLRGCIAANGSGDVGPAELLVLERTGDEVHIDAAVDSALLLLSGEPIAEPIVGYGPFVMNSRQEIEAAMNDFQRGKFGRMPATAAAPAGA